MKGFGFHQITAEVAATVVIINLKFVKKNVFAISTELNSDFRVGLSATFI